MRFNFLKKTIKLGGDYHDLGLLDTRQQVYEFLSPDSILSQLPYWVGFLPVLHLQASMLVMPGGHRFISEQHPFIIALKNGKEGLTEFYSDCSPKNIIELYGITPKGLQGECLEPWELPWLLRKRVPPRGEGGLSDLHGVSFYGPSSDAKVDLEMQRLNAILNSISDKGYIPRLKGHIEGFFLRNGSDYRFFILGGKHRAAVLTFMGHERIPVRVRNSVPRIIDRKDAENWPLVRDGSIAKELALKIFDCYFKSNGS